MKCLSPSHPSLCNGRDCESRQEPKQDTTTRNFRNDSVSFQQILVNNEYAKQINIHKTKNLFSYLDFHLFFSNRESESLAHKNYRKSKDIEQ